MLGDLAEEGAFYAGRGAPLDSEQRVILIRQWLTATLAGGPAA